MRKCHYLLFLSEWKWADASIWLAYWLTKIFISSLFQLLLSLLFCLWAWINGLFCVLFSLRLLNLSLTSDLVPEQDVIDVIIHVGRNPQGRNLAWKYFREKWDILNARWGDYFQFESLSYVEINTIIQVEELTTVSFLCSVMAKLCSWTRSSLVESQSSWTRTKNSLR